MTDAHALRLQLVQAGYLPIPLHGKIPPQREWQKTESVTPAMLTMWDKSWPDALNTGVLCRTTPTLDVDVTDEAATEAIEQFVRDRYEDAGYVLTRIGKPPKFAIPFRTEEPFKKFVASLIAPNGAQVKIEFLGDGEQVVVNGIHPDTKQPYRWSNGGLEQVKHEDLPYIRETEARALVWAIVEMLCRDFGYKRTAGRPKDKANGTTRPSSDWTHLIENVLTGREWHDSLSILAAKMAACGTNSGAAINQLNAFMDATTAPKDARWLARKGEIPRLVDSAFAKFAKPPPRSSSEPEAEAEPTPTPTPSTASSPRLRATHNVFRKWLDDEYDIDVLDAVLAAAAAERLGGDPLWLLVISGPGNAKTETVQALMGAGAMITSTITSEGALLSATKKNTKGATGGLLCELGDRGILVIKDVTSILAADRNARGLVLSAIREIYDGRWVRNVGNDGGRKLVWTGRIVVVGAVTTAWDTAHSVIATMGDRFVIIRADSSQGRVKSATKAIRNINLEIQMRKELAHSAGALIKHIDKKEYVLTDDEINRLIKAADIVTAARTGVERDYRGEVINAHALEMPTRFAKQLGQLVRGAVTIGATVEHAMHLAIRCARDSIPPLRCEILLDIAGHPKSEPHEVHRRIGRPRHTVRRELEALHMLRLLQCKETDERNDKGKIVGTIYKYSLGDAFDLATLKAMTAPPTPPKKD